MISRMVWVIVIVLLIAIPIGVSRGRAQGKQRTLGRDRCQFCRTKLKLMADRKSFAGTCRKCGRTQKWAGGTS